MANRTMSNRTILTAFSKPLPNIIQGIIFTEVVPQLTPEIETANLTHAPYMSMVIVFWNKPIVPPDG